MPLLSINTSIRPVSDRRRLAQAATDYQERNRRMRRDKLYVEDQNTVFKVVLLNEIGKGKKGRQGQKTKRPAEMRGQEQRF
jgi:hypothetical protein